MFVFVDDVFFVGCEDVFPFEEVDPVALLLPDIDPEVLLSLEEAAFVEDPEALLLSDPEALLSPDEVVLVSVFESDFVSDFVLSDFVLVDFTSGFVSDLFLDESSFTESALREVSDLFDVFVVLLSDLETEESFFVSVSVDTEAEVSVFGGVLTLPHPASVDRERIPAAKRYNILFFIFFLLLLML